MNVVRIDLLKSRIDYLVVTTFIWLPLVKYLILRIFVIHFIRSYCETPYKIDKLLDIWRHFEHLRVLAETFGDIGRSV